MNTVSSGSLDWLHEKGFRSQDLICFQYPSAEEFDRAKLQIVYLGWFWKDWSIFNNGIEESPIISPMPGVACHLKEDHMTPLINWTDIWQAIEIYEEPK